MAQHPLVRLAAKLTNSKRGEYRPGGVSGAKPNRRVLQEYQAYLDREHKSNAKGINGPQSDGWVDAHTRREKSGKMTNVKAYRVPPH